MIPKTVKVAGFTYQVERSDKSFVNGSNAVDGVHDFANLTIKVSKNGTDEYQKHVFLHEVCHAIVECYCDRKSDEESFVEQFSKGIYQVMNDNPEVFMPKLSENLYIKQNTSDTEAKSTVGVKRTIGDKQYGFVKEFQKSVLTISDVESAFNELLSNKSGESE